MKLDGKQVIVVGLGASGLAAARLCLSRGASVIGTDRAPLEDLSRDAQALDIELVTGGHEGVDFSGADLIVVSPGVPTFPQLARAESSGVEVIGEFELASRFIEVPILCVGGTNGKSTVTILLGHLLEAAGLRVFVGANLGTPASDAAGQELDVAVMELSSFQLERAPTFRPRVSVLLNISEDHLDRYASFDEYANAKGRAFVNQQPGDVAIVPFGEARCRAQAERGKGTIVTFGTGGDYECRSGRIVECKTGRGFSLDDIDMHGKHNQANAAAAVAAARAFGVEVEHVMEGFRRFRPLPHRMAFVGRSDDVSFYDDSKATNVDAAVTALGGLSEDHAVLIAGGRDKGGSYAPLAQALKEKGRALVVMGEAQDRIVREVRRLLPGEKLPIERVRAMGEAVERAFELARPGDAVLLSPACSSLDMFDNYAERGDAFIEAVERLRMRSKRGGG